MTLSKLLKTLTKEGFIIELSYYDILDCIRVRMQKDTLYDVMYVSEEERLPFFIKEMAINIKEKIREKWREDEYGKILDSSNQYGRKMDHDR